MKTTVLALGALACAACAPSSQAIRHEALSRMLEHDWRADHGAEPAAIERALRSEATLDRRALVRAVLARNPSLDAVREAWQAALARQDEVSALDDPMVSYSFAPASIFDGDVRYGQVVGLSQKLPWPGKLAARADVALGEAEAIAEDYETARLDLGLRACRAFDRYYAVERALEINAEHERLARSLQRSIESHYAVGKGMLYDPLQAEVELAHIAHDRKVLASARAVIVAELNALLHAEPHAPLPPPPRSLDPVAGPVEPRAELQARALGRRSELRALAARDGALEARLEMAESDRYPDVTVSGSYNSMWSALAHQFMVGVSVNVPLQTGRRDAAERAAEARLAENRHRSEALADAVRAEVQAALVRLEEAQHVLGLFESRLLPLARQQAEAVRPAFAAGEASFFEVLATERAVWRLERGRHEALATIATRASEVERALGLMPGLAHETEGGDR